MKFAYEAVPIRSAVIPDDTLKEPEIDTLPLPLSYKLPVPRTVSLINLVI
jgi:hypothetical protein